MRDDEWLVARLDHIWSLLFPEVARKNQVIAIFKGKWQNKFGHIKLLNDKSSEIAVNGLFKHEEIPEYIIDLTLAHELIHYGHGFNSPHKRKFKHPHKGGVVTKDLLKHGFGHLIRKEKVFIRREWPKIHGVLKARELGSSFF